MAARTRWVNWSMGALALGLSFVMLAGCRSSSGSRSSGCGSCRGQSCEIDGVAYSPGVTAMSVGSSLEKPALDANGLAAKQLPGTTASPPALYGGQNTCPVTGEDLGSMGPAIPVTVRGQTIYVCCRGCAADVQRDPDPYLAKVQAGRR